MTAHSSSSITPHALVGFGRHNRAGWAHEECYRVHTATVEERSTIPMVDSRVLYPSPASRRLRLGAHDAPPCYFCGAPLRLPPDPLALAGFPFDSFLAAYTAAALWADLPWDDPLPLSFPPKPGPGEFDPSPYLPRLTRAARRLLRDDATQFILSLPPALLALVAANPEQAGHDAWLTRQRHGCGFWSRPEIWGDDPANELSDLARAQGERYLMVSRNGWINIY